MHIFKITNILSAVHILGLWSLDGIPQAPAGQLHKLTHHLKKTCKDTGQFALDKLHLKGFSVFVSK